MSTNIREIAKRTIQTEAEAVSGLISLLDESFEKAGQAIHQSAGHLVISGIGKSAIVAQKIVATLNSTGTPSLFMHAADAIHGDLGMVQPQDFVLLISKSGESPEIKVLVPLVKNAGNILLALCGNIHSYLATQADYVLNTTVAKEACPNNLAPTSSTTAQMVIGDALAVCLMELNGFSGRDFAKNHPGGNLGKRLYLRVEDLYAVNAKPAVLNSAGLKEVIIAISAGRLGATAVLDEANKATGIITDGDVRRMLETTDNLSRVKAADILTLHPKTIQPGALAIEALERMREADISQLIVVSADNRYLGILHLHDLVREGII